MQRVWRAITEPDELAEWFPSNVEVDLESGGRMHFEFPAGEMTLDGEVTELDQPRVFAFLWGEDQLRFELEPDGDGCRLHLTVKLDARNKAARDAAGWHVCLDALERLLSGEAVEEPHENDGWRGHYEEYQRRGLPTGAPVPEQAG